MIWVLWIYVSVPQIPLLTAVLMVLIYKVLTSVNKPSWCCWDLLLSQFSRRRCWEGFVICWDHCGLWTKPGIEFPAFNSQPWKAGAAAQLSGSTWLTIAIFPVIRMFPRFPFQDKGFSYHLLDQTSIRNVVCVRSEHGPGEGKNLRKFCVCPGSQSGWMLQGELLSEDSCNLNGRRLEKGGFPSSLL